MRAFYFLALGATLKPNQRAANRHQRTTMKSRSSTTRRKSVSRKRAPTVKRLRVHTAEKKFVQGVSSSGNRFRQSHKCGTCGKTFPYASHLQRHKRIHTSKTPLHCNICPKKFKLKENLTKHRLLHAGECPKCGKKFRNVSQLKEHLRTHPKKKYKCETCGKICRCNSH